MKMNLLIPTNADSNCVYILLLHICSIERGGLLGNSVFRETLHHVAEFIELYFSIPVFINFGNDLINFSWVYGTVKAQDLLDLVGRESSTIIFIKHFECHLEPVIRHQILFLDGCHDELRIVDCAISIQVYFLEHFVHLFFCDCDSEVLLVAKKDLFLAEVSITVYVYSFKYLVKVTFLLILGQMGGDESKSCLLQFRVALKNGQIFE